jgi:hypothetical protein
MVLHLCKLYIFSVTHSEIDIAVDVMCHTGEHTPVLLVWQFVFCCCSLYVYSNLNSVLFLDTPLFAMFKVP